MGTTNDKAARLIAALATMAVNAGEPNFSISVSGDKCTIESEQGEVMAQQATIKSIHLYIDLGDCEHDRE